MRGVLRDTSFFLAAATCLWGYSPQDQINNWTAAASLHTARAGACSVRMENGRVLIAGGMGPSGPLASAESYGVDGFAEVAPMAERRANPACVALPDGRVLVTGGSDGSAALSSAEIYNPASDQWSATGGMLFARAGHNASLTPWGTVLITGGEPTGSLEIFDTNGVFHSIGRLSVARNNGAVAILEHRRILLAGGTSNGSAVAAMDIYNADDGTVARAPDMLVPRSDFTAVPLLDGTVLLAGGNDQSGHPLASTEIFDPAQAVVVPGPALGRPRAGHRAYVLPQNGQVLIVGGTDGRSDLDATELYVPWDGGARAGRTLPGPRTALAIAPFRRGEILVAGGENGGWYLTDALTYRFATIASDKPDYAPGETSTLTGTGWKPGESVLLRVVTVPSDQHRTEFTAIAQADGNGQVRYPGFAIDRSHLGVRFLATAVGSESQAQATFTDAITPQVTITTSPAVLTTGTPFTVTVTLGGTPAPTGLVQLVIDHATVGAPVAVGAGGTTTFNHPGLSIGGHTIGINYSGDANYSPTFEVIGIPGQNPIPITVLDPSATSLTLLPSAGQPLGSGLTISGHVSGTAIPLVSSGNVQITLDGTPIGTIAVNATGDYSMSYGAASVGTHAVLANFQGNSNHGPSTGGSAGNYVVTKVLPSISIATVPANPSAGVAFSVVLTLGGVGGLTPTGQVQLVIDHATIGGLVALNGAGIATISYPSGLTAGSHTIGFNYTGDLNYLPFYDAIPVTGNPITIVIGKASQVITVISPAPASATFNTTFPVAATAPGGPVAIGVSGACTISSGMVTINAASGTCTTTFSQGGNALYNPAPDVVETTTIGRIPTTTSLSGPLAPALNQPTVFMASVVTNVPGAPALTGTVSFTLNGAPVSSCQNLTLISGGVPCSFSFGQNGAYSLGAAYSGDANALPSTGTLQINVTSTAPENTVMVSLFSNLRAPDLSQPITFTALLDGGGPQIGGTIQFFDGSTLIGTVPVIAGQAILTISLGAGGHNITAIYGGSGNNSGAISNALGQYVYRIPSTVSIATSVVTPVYGQASTIMAQVAVQPPAGFGTPTGQIEFFDGTSVIGTAAITGGVAAIPGSGLDAGAHRLSAVYLGDATWNTSKSKDLPQTVGQASTAVSVTPLPDVSGPQPQLTLTANVGVVAPGGGSPSGSVQFVDVVSNTVLATAPVVNGSAASVLMADNVGRLITATYSGSHNYIGGASPATPQVSIVNAAGFVSPATAPDAIMTIFGYSLSDSVASPPTTPLPTSLAGTSVSVKDSQGAVRPAELFYVSPTQINFLMPTGTAPGTATVTVTDSQQRSSSIITSNANTAPGLFSANSTGKGLAAAQIVRVRADGTQTLTNIAAYDSASGTIVPVPIDLSDPTEKVFLILYGTGLRYAPDVTSIGVTINGISMPILFSGAQPLFAGLDQINVGPLPASLRGAGAVDIQVTVNAEQSNTVSATFK